MAMGFRGFDCEVSPLELALRMPKVASIVVWVVVSQLIMSTLVWFCLESSSFIGHGAE